MLSHAQPRNPTIDLAIGDPTDAPPSVLQVMLEASVRDVRATHYTPSMGEPDLLQAVSRYYTRTQGLSLDAGTQVLITQGARPALFFALLALGRPGRAAGFISPSYVGFKPIIADAGMRPVPFETGKWPSTPRELDEMFSPLRGGCFIFNNPHNPVGFVVPPAQIAELAAAAGRHEVKIISDAVYAELHEGPVPPSLLRFDASAVEVISISKTFRACGWRVGAVSGDPAWLRRMKEMYVAMNGVPFAYQEVFAYALDNLPEVDAFRAEVRKRRAVLADGIRALGFGVDTQVNNRGGIFVWAAVPAAWRASSQEAAALIRRTGVNSTPGSDFGKAGEGFLRFALNVPSTELMKAVERIATVKVN